MKRQQHNGHHDYDEQTKTTNQRRTSGSRDTQDTQRDYSNYGSEYDERWEGQPRGNRNEDWQGEQRGNERSNWGSWNQDHEWRGSRGNDTGRNYGNSSGNYGNQDYNSRSNWNEYDGQRGNEAGNWNDYDSQRYSGSGDNRNDYDRQRYGNRNERSDYGAQGNYGNQSYYGTSGNYGNPGNYGNQRGNTNRDFDSNRMQENRYGSDWSSDRQQGMHRGVGPKGYQRSDERIKEDVNDRLTDDGMLNASEIEVEVTGGEVVLSGTVESRNEKRRAEDVAEAVSGVKNVENHLRVSQGNTGSRQSGMENKSNTQQAQKQNKTT